MVADVGYVERKIILLHYRLGHPSFNNLSYTLTSLKGWTIVDWCAMHASLGGI
jgi:hypothetical protein